MHDQQQAEQHEEVAGQHEQPVAMCDGPGLGAAQGTFRASWEEDGKQDEADDQHGADREDGVVNIETHDLDIVLADLVVRVIRIR